MQEDSLSIPYSGVFEMAEESLSVSPTDSYFDSVDVIEVSEVLATCRIASPVSMENFSQSFIP